MDRAISQDKGERMVLLSGRDLEEARRLLRLLAEGSTGEVVMIPRAWQAQPITREALIAAAGRELAHRRQRLQLFPEGVFGEPAWELLLVLYIEQQGERLNIARLTRRVGLPPSSALRWLRYLQDKDLVARTGHPTDQRAFFVDLTSKAIQTLDVYFSGMLTQSA
jgi:hypothetical protein